MVCVVARAAPEFARESHSACQFARTSVRPVSCCAGMNPSKSGEPAVSRANSRRMQSTHAAREGRVCSPAKDAGGAAGPETVVAALEKQTV